MRHAFLPLLAAASLLLAACTSSHVLTGTPRPPIDPAQVRIYYGPPPGGYEEIARLSSPDGRVDAVVVEVDAGAGNPFVYRLYVVPRGGAWRTGGERLSYRVQHFVAAGES